MSKVIFIEECNYLLEANYFLLRYFSGETFKKLEGELKKELCIADNVKLLNKMDDIFHEVLSRVQINESLSKYYQLFSDEDSFNYYLAINMLMFAIKDDISDFGIVGDHIKKKFKENRLEFISLLLSIDIDEDIETNEDVFTAMLEESNINDEYKWSILQVYNHFDLHLDILLLELEKISQILKEVYTRFQGEYQGFIDYWKVKCQDVKCFHEAINVHVSVKLDPKDTIVVRPALMGLNSISMYVFENSDCAYLYIGLLFQDKSLLLSGISTERLAEIIKLLADKSKMEILKLIKDKGYYGAELADKMKLTTATISYHMNSLANSNLIGITKEANRVYYHLNKDFLVKVINQLNNDLLN